MSLPKRNMALTTLDVTVETITRPMAEKYLATQETNRRLNRAVVSRYASEMLAGNWRLHGQGIQFDTEGRLIDGQHRLTAIVQSGCSIDMLVVRGADQSVANVIDVGRRRSAADQLGADGVKYSKRLAAALGLLWRYRSEQTHGIRVTGFKTWIPNTEIVRMWNENPEIERSVYATEGVKSFLVISHAIFCHFLFSKINEQQADEFFALLASGGGLRDKHPILTLRNRLIEAKLMKQRRPHHLWHAAITIKAWNAYRKNETAQLKWRIGGENPESFPIPE